MQGPISHATKVVMLRHTQPPRNRHVFSSAATSTFGDTTLSRYHLPCDAALHSRRTAHLVAPNMLFQTRQANHHCTASPATLAVL
eukprot:8493314-Pyramimonas_sp.AAC.1